MSQSAAAVNAYTQHTCVSSVNAALPNKPVVTKHCKVHYTRGNCYAARPSSVVQMYSEVECQQGCLTVNAATATASAAASATSTSATRGSSAST
eukprot:2413-Heterococcus_DN1.PRE.2